MALLSSPLLLRTHAIILFTLAYYLLTAPSTLLSSPALTLLGESMRLPPAHFQPISSSNISPTPLATAASTELLALLALVLAVAATTQLLFAGSLGVPVTLSFTTSQASRSGSGGNEAWKNQLPSLAGAGGAKVSRARRGEDLAVLSAAQNTHMGLAFVRVLVEGVLVAWIYVAFGRRSNTTGGSDNLGGLGLAQGVGAALGNQVVFTAALGDMLFWGYLWTVVREERREVFRGVEKWRAEEAERDE